MTSTEQVRDLNASLLLNQFWEAPVDTGLTGSELVEGTGLTRSTVLAISEELREIGWVIEDRAPSLVPGRGRQARRFTFNRTRQLVVAADIGIQSVTSVVADLKGTVLGRAHHSFGTEEWEADRTLHLLRTIDEAVQEAGIPIDRVGAACLGVAAPIGPNGEPFPGSPYWDLVRIDLSKVRTYGPDWIIGIENDADLAAVAELQSPMIRAMSSSLTLLAGERFGAGIVINGEIFRGAHGGAGEMSYLERIEGLKSSIGLAAAARILVLEAIAAGRDSVLRGNSRPSLDAISSAADEGDALALEVMGQLEERLAVIIATLSSFLDPDAVVIAGGIAELVAPMVDRIRVRLPDLIPHPPTVVASTLGRDVVLQGAVRSAITTIRQGALSS